MSEVEENRFNDSRDSFDDQEYLQEYLERVAVNLGLSKFNYNIKFATKKGDNYVGVLYRVLITGEKNGLPVEIRTIFKVPPNGDDIRKALRVDYLFPREHTVYSEIVPIFKEFLKTKNKNLENIAECYLSSDVYKKEVICLQDLRQKGFTLKNLNKFIDFPHASLAFRALGRFHALSFALRDQKPDIFKNKIATLEEPLFKQDLIDNPPFITRMQQIGNLVKTALAEEDPKYTERVSRFLDDISNHIRRSCDGSLAEPYAVLGHGDYWLNNMLFNYRKDSAEPTEIYLLDFQLSRYSSPAVDIAYSLFCNATNDLRTNYFDDLLKIYHESLSSYLVELGSDATKLFTFDSLRSQLENFSAYSGVMALIVIPIFTIQGEEDNQLHPDNSDLPRIRERILRDDLFRNTLRDTFKDLIDRNYI